MLGRPPGGESFADVPSARTCFSTCSFATAGLPVAAFGGSGVLLRGRIRIRRGRTVKEHKETTENVAFLKQQTSAESPASPTSRQFLLIGVA